MNFSQYSLSFSVMSHQLLRKVSATIAAKSSTVSNSQLPTFCLQVGAEKVEFREFLKTALCCSGESESKQSQRS